jgi:hypothetical protein
LVPKNRGRTMLLIESCRGSGRRFINFVRTPAGETEVFQLVKKLIESC